jgi:hypothetical protein
MNDHQETLDQTVKRIEASFDKVESYSKKAGDYRITAGKLLVELQARIEAGEDGEGVEWWKWYAEHFERTRRDAQKVMALARSDNPEQAAEDEREKNREAVAAHRKRVAEAASYSKTQPDEAAESFNDNISEVITAEASANERKAQYAAEEATDTPADVDPVAHTLEATDAPAEQSAKEPDSKDEEITWLKARIVELEAATASCSACGGPGGVSLCGGCVATRAAAAPPPKRGRPPGSKNKPKAAGGLS